MLGFVSWRGRDGESELHRAMKNQKELVPKGSEKPVFLSCFSLSGQHRLL